MSRINEPHIVIGVDLKAVSIMPVGKQTETASMALLPDLTVVQLTQLTEQSYKPNTLLETKNSKTRYIFIPTNQLFEKRLGRFTRKSLRIVRGIEKWLSSERSRFHARSLTIGNLIDLSFRFSCLENSKQLSSFKISARGAIRS
jgi:hypothetical protein